MKADKNWWNLDVIFNNFYREAFNHFDLYAIISRMQK